MSQHPLEYSCVRFLGHCLPQKWDLVGNAFVYWTAFIASIVITLGEFTVEMSCRISLEKLTFLSLFIVYHIILQRNERIVLFIYIVSPCVLKQWKYMQGEKTSRCVWISVCHENRKRYVSKKMTLKDCQQFYKLRLMMPPFPLLSPSSPWLCSLSPSLPLP